MPSIGFKEWISPIQYHIHLGFLFISQWDYLVCNIEQNKISVSTLLLLPYLIKVINWAQLVIPVDLSINIIPHSMLRDH